jgi:type IV pilus assembly protein PilB
MAKRDGDRKKLGEVLLGAGLITAWQIEDALAKRGTTKKRLGQMLVELGYVNDDQIAKTLAHQLGLQLVDVKNAKIPENARRAIPAEKARERSILPLTIKNNELTVAMCDPLDWQTIQEIEFHTNHKVQIVVSTEGSIAAGIEANYPRKAPQPAAAPQAATAAPAPGAPAAASATAPAQAAPASTPTETLNRVFDDAVRYRATAVHMDPLDKETGQVRFRVDGRLSHGFTLPRASFDALADKLKVTASLSAGQKNVPLEGTCLVQAGGKGVDIKVSTLPSIKGEALVVNLFDRDADVIPFARLGVPREIMPQILEIAFLSQGLLLVSGPPGSGKATTMYSLLQQMDTEGLSIVTAEESVHYTVPGIKQIAVDNRGGLSYASALNYIIRQDPDVIVLGDVPDRQVTEAATRAAMTGQLVMGAVSATDAVSTITWLLDEGISPYTVRTALTGVLSQRLLRRICPECREETQPGDHPALRNLPKLMRAFKGKGCPSCSQTGYKGRVPVFEFLRMTPSVRAVVSAGVKADDLKTVARAEGYRPMFDDAWAKVTEGLTTVDEVLSGVPIHTG